MPVYKVLDKGFYDGIFRAPGDNDPVITTRKFKECPSWLEYVASNVETKKALNDVDVDVIKGKADYKGDGIEVL